MNTLEVQARTKLDNAERAYQDAMSGVESRLAALPDTATLQDVEKIESEARSQLDTAEAAVKEARAQFEATERIARARSADPIASQYRGNVQVLSEPRTYDPRDPRGPSFFKDLYNQQRSNAPDATERLQRNTRETLIEAEKNGVTYRDKEGRALSSTAGAGGDFLPPLYFGDLYAEFKRARRVTANLCRQLPLAAHGNTITVPKFTGGTLTGSQQDNQNVTTQDATTSIITIPVCTVAGYVDLSRQIVERSEPGMDQLVFEDLLKDYDKRVNTYILSGSGSSGQPKGILNTSYNSVVFTSGSPTVAGLWPKLSSALQQVEEQVFEPATAFVMTARRWAWILAALDSNNRPFVVPSEQGPYQAMGRLNTGEGAYGNDTSRAAGTMFGLPVYIDETLPKTQGSSTNQDVIVAANFNEHLLWEDENGPRQFTFAGVTSQTAAIRCQIFGYLGFTAERFSTATSVITGTGLVAPSL